MYSSMKQVLDYCCMSNLENISKAFVILHAKKLYKARGNWLQTQVFAIPTYPLVPKFEYHKA